MQLWHLDSIKDRTMSGVACHHSAKTTHTVEHVRRGMPLSPLDTTHDRTTLGVECHYLSLKEHTIKHSQAWHAHVALGNHTRSNDVGREMPS